MTSDELHGEGFYNPDNVEEDRKYPSLAGFMAVNYALLLAMLALPTVPLIWILR